jgi:TonB family protein
VPPDSETVRIKILLQDVFLAAILLLVFAGTLGAAHADEQVAAYAEAVDDLIYAPKPEYPYDARLGYLEGAGKFKVEVDFETGKVKSVTITKSTSQKMLDDVVINTLRTWRLKPS